MDMSGIAGITASGGNRLTFAFGNGETVEKQWKDRSRSESWTEEKRKQAGERRKAVIEKCRKET